MLNCDTYRNNLSMQSQERLPTLLSSSSSSGLFEEDLSKSKLSTVNLTDPTHEPPSSSQEHTTMRDNDDNDNVELVFRNGDETLTLNERRDSLSHLTVQDLKKKFLFKLTKDNVNLELSVDDKEDILDRSTALKDIIQENRQKTFTVQYNKNSTKITEDAKKAMITLKTKLCEDGEPINATQLKKRWRGKIEEFKKAVKNVFIEPYLVDILKQHPFLFYFLPEELSTEDRLIKAAHTENELMRLKEILQQDIILFQFLPEKFETEDSLIDVTVTGLLEIRKKEAFF